MLLTFSCLCRTLGLSINSSALYFLKNLTDTGFIPYLSLYRFSLLVSEVVTAKSGILTKVPDEKLIILHSDLLLFFIIIIIFFL